MQERVTRAELLRWIAPRVGLAILFGGDIAYALRLPRRSYDQTFLEREIDGSVDQILSHIQVEDETFVPFESNGGAVLPRVNKTNLASTLINTAFLDGGTKEVAAVVRIITANGIVVKEKESQENWAETRLPSLAQRHAPMELIFTPGLIRDYYQHLPDPLEDSTVFHELYHLIQYCRNETGYRILSGAMMMAQYLLAAKMASMLAAAVYKKAAEAPVQMEIGGENRLPFALGLVAGVLSIEPFARAFQVALWPVDPGEVQANVQAGFGSFLPIRYSGLLLSKLPSKLKGQMFSFINF